ncbi:MAG: hypothetical protein QGH60_03400 [Phycisphaerae bacterium]|nr:hypothetical protein [Phycisphaerae bacterium]
MGKDKIPVGRGPRDDWHEMIQSMKGDSLFACEGGASASLGVKIEKERTVIRGGLDMKMLLGAGGMSLAGVVLLVCGVVSLFGGLAILNVVLLIVGLGAAGGGCFMLLSRPGITMSPDGRELILAIGPRRRFHLDAKNLIPRLSLASEPDGDDDSQEVREVHLKLFNIKLRQAVVLITGGQDHAGAICRSLDEMLGTDSMDSTFAEVKLAGMGDDWVNVEAPPADDLFEALADGQAPAGDEPRAERAGRPMCVGGIIFSGARLIFPARGIAIVKLPLIRRFALPVGIIMAGWIVVVLLLSVVGGSAGLPPETAMLVGEIAFAALAVCVSMIFWYHGGPITIDRKKNEIVGPRRNKCGFAGQPISISEVAVVQTCLNAPRDASKANAGKTPVSSYELNLVMKDLPRRVHLITDTNGDRVRESARTLAKFLEVSHWDCTGEDQDEDE